MNKEFGLGDYLNQVRKMQGITFAEMGKRMGNDRRKPMKAQHVNDAMHRGESLSVKSLREICEAMDCDLKIEVIPKKGPKYF